ncbi:uncharacterized protein LOC110013159 [Sesamum indicum]|uniref:Uncharacterized protein LOC110013159 n=1 Tax=Sesamum indicum TaxID=4182 RepID=A0A8M8VDM3_SESIN|nr:uncharacterized protein LOC110013159 [Sesamum indicum]
MASSLAPSIWLLHRLSIVLSIKNVPSMQLHDQKLLLWRDISPPNVRPEVIQPP